MYLLRKDIIFIVLIILFGIAALISTDRYYDSKWTYSKFKVGDCVLVDYSNEFKTSVYYYSILNVGKKQYLVRVKPAEYHTYLNSNSVSHKFDLNQYELTDNTNCLPQNKEK